MTAAWDIFDTHFGPMLAEVNDENALTRLHIGPDAAQRIPADANHDPARLAAVGRQLAEYCAGERRQFDLPLAPRGTSFQQSAWQALLQIPFGETRSYLQQAQLLGNTAAVRAVGRANGANPIGLIVPCHRVIGSDGSLTGYAGGLPLNQALLAFEREVAGYASLSLF